MDAKNKWTLAPAPDRPLVARVREHVREVTMLRTLVALQCNRYAIQRQTLLAEVHGLIEWPTAPRETR